MTTVYTSDIHTHVGHATDHSRDTTHTHHATTHGTRPANATSALHELSTVRTSLSARPRASARPPSQSQAQARKGRRADGCTLGRQLWGTAERKSLARRPARRGGRRPVEQACQEGQQACCVSHGAWVERGGGEVARSHGMHGAERERSRRAGERARVRAGPRTLIVGVSTPPEPASGVVPHWARRIFI